MRLARLVLPLLAMLAASPALAKMVAKPVDWTLDGTTFRSMLVYDDASTTKRPGLVMVPNWFGINDTAISKAKMVAGQDYVILLTDMYGEGTRPRSDAQAKVAVGPLYADRGLMRKRIGRAFEQLKAEAAGAPIDLSRLAPSASVSAVAWCSIWRAAART